MKRLALIIVLTLSVALTYSFYKLYATGYITFGYQASTYENTEPSPPDEEVIEELVNEYRVKKDLKSLKHDERLCDIAKSRLEEVSVDFSHSGFKKYYIENNPDAFYIALGENLAESSSKDYEYITVAKWLKSATHRENIELPYTHTCVKSDKNHVVQIFAAY